MIYCSGESTSVTSSIGAGDVVVEGHRDRVVVHRSGGREQFRWRPVARSEAETTGGVGVAVAQPSATETYAGAWLSPYRAVSHAPAVLRRAWRVVASSVTDDVAWEGRELLAALEDGLRQFNDCADYLPRLSAAVTDGQIQFRIGAALLPRDEIEQLRRRPLLIGLLEYERRPLDDNPYHGNILVRAGTSKPTRNLIASGLALAVTEIIPQAADA